MKRLKRTWNVSVVTNMSFMFYGATAFNKDINTRIVTVNGNSYTAWNVHAVTIMNGMFVDSGLQNNTPGWY